MYHGAESAESGGSRLRSVRIFVGSASGIPIGHINRRHTALPPVYVVNAVRPVMIPALLGIQNYSGT